MFKLEYMKVYNMNIMFIRFTIEEEWEGGRKIRPQGSPQILKLNWLGRSSQVFTNWETG